MTVELATLIPVYQRPQNVEPLVLSWLTSGTPGHLVFIAETDDIDEQAAIERVIRNHRIQLISTVEAHTWPQKINTAIHEIDADWYCLAADDVRFHPRWYDKTKKLREKYGLIGTNDLGNPRVPLEQLIIHPLMSREYAALGLFDDPTAGPVNEAYWHWCCDDELLWTGKLRGQYAFCKDAVIEHLHPYWGKAADDDTYALGELHQVEDMKLWMDRAVHVLQLGVS